jgi:hypothetical protein
MEYMIGAGAVLETGAAAKATPAMVHARVDAALSRSVGAAAIDFEGSSADSMRRLLVLVPGWNARRFRMSVTDRLVERGTCSLADVLATVAGAAGVSEVHLFSHWLPDDRTCRTLAKRGIGLTAYPLEAIHTAAVVAGQRHTRWKASPAA